LNDNVNKNIILLVSTLGAFWAPFITSSVNIALPYIGRDFAIGSSMLNWVTSSTILAIAIFILPVGKLSDLLGRRKIMFVGTLILTVSSLFCGIAQSITFLLFSRVFQGIGSAMISISVISIVCSVFPPKERGKALGINVACTYIGLSLGPIIGGAIITYTSWRGIFLFSLPIGVILSLLLFNILSDDEQREGKESFDGKGSILYGLSIFMIIFGLSNLLLHPWSKYILLLGIASIFLFIYIEDKVQNPILNVNVLKSNRVLIFSSLASMINYSSTFAISYLMSLYLQLVKHLDPSTAGMVLLTQPALQALLSPLAGRLSDKVAPQILASIGMAFITLGLLLFSFFDKNTSVFVIILLLGMIGVGFALFSSPNTNAIMTSVDKQYFGVASGIIGTARTVGQSFSMSLTALISSIFLGNAQLTDKTIPGFLMSFKTSFIILAILCLFGVFASLARGKSSSKNLV